MKARPSPFILVHDPAGNSIPSDARVHVVCCAFVVVNRLGFLSTGRIFPPQEYPFALSPMVHCGLIGCNNHTQRSGSRKGGVSTIKLGSTGKRQQFNGG